MNGLLQIGEVASQTGLTVDAIRFYEREKLLHTAVRSSGGFRLFSSTDIDDITFIRNAQELGFSLQEIRELLSLKQKPHPNCKQVEQFLEHKIVVVRRKIASLRQLERELQQAVADCQSNLRRVTGGPVEDCPVLNDISHARKRKRK